MREGFRPFAPAVLLQDASLHFDIDHPSPFMLETCQVHSPLALPAITHIDGSARLQTVDPDQSPNFGRLIAEFKRLTGCPVILNTSFNVRGEPIVCSPVDALQCFLCSGLDAVVLNELIVQKAAVDPAIITAALDRRNAPKSSIVHDMYTFI
jgi:carbamoyltransferase